MNAHDATAPDAFGGKLRPVRRNTLSDTIAQQIIELIANGDLKAGQRIPPERELCKRFSVGRSSVREALRCLAIVGILDARVGDGTSVAADSQKFINTILGWQVVTKRRSLESLFEVRLALESDIAAFAASRATDDEIARIAGNVAAMENVLRKPRQFAELDLQFHLLIAEASRNDLMNDLVVLIRGQLQRAVDKSISIPGGAELALEQHNRVLDALRARDSLEARRRMRLHLESALARYRGSAAEAEALAY